MTIEYGDVLIVDKNQRGVEYLRKVHTSDVLAKKCTECFGWKLLQDFNKAGKGFAGTHSLCRGCHNQNSIEYRSEMQRKADNDKKYAEQLHQHEQEREQHFAEMREAHHVRRSIIF